MAPMMTRGFFFNGTTMNAHWSTCYNRSLDQLNQVKHGMELRSKTSLPSGVALNIRVSSMYAYMEEKGT